MPVVIAPVEIIAFSSAHARVGVPNHTGLTRVSLETRTVSIADVRAGRGAPNVDSRGRWAAPGMFRRLSDGWALHELLGCEPLIPYADGGDQASDKKSLPIVDITARLRCTAVGGRAIHWTEGLLPPDVGTRPGRDLSPSGA